MMMGTLTLDQPYNIFYWLAVFRKERNSYKHQNGWGKPSDARSQPYHKA